MSPCARTLHTRSAPAPCSSSWASLACSLACALTSFARSALAPCSSSRASLETCSSSRASLAPCSSSTVSRACKSFNDRSATAARISATSISLSARRARLSDLSARRLVSAIKSRASRTRHSSPWGSPHLPGAAVSAAAAGGCGGDRRVRPSPCATRAASSAQVVTCVRGSLNPMLSWTSASGKPSQRSATSSSQRARPSRSSTASLKRRAVPGGAAMAPVQHG
mmetsp:Transcript_70189/g.182994  ORF Transcript_70189/g.182994 Transcript_70189/m.182994 type:complete len:224 (-) Transcript_70189:182-853(-)